MSISKAKKPPLSPLLDRIQKCIDEKIRPFIQMDGGDIELVELNEGAKSADGKIGFKILRAKLHGACVGCMASAMTLQYGVQNAINEEFPEEDIQLELVQSD